MGETLSALTTLPRSNVEPTELLLAESTTSASLLGVSLAAPTALSASNVDLRLPRAARSGRPIQFEFSFSNRYVPANDTERRIALASLCSHAIIDVLFDCAGYRQMLATTFAPSSNGRGITVSAYVPESAIIGDTVSVLRAVLAGEPVQVDKVLPARLRVTVGMRAPALLSIAGGISYALSPSITADGMLCVPRSSDGPILFYDSDGTALPQLPLNSTLKVSSCTAVASCTVSDLECGSGVVSGDIVLVADYNSTSPHLTAYSQARRAVLWTVPLGGGGFRGIATLPARGIVAVCNYNSFQLHAHRLTDGARVSSTRAAYFPACLAADPDRDTVYACLGHRVAAFRWDGSTFVEDGVVVAAGDRRAERLLAVMPSVYSSDSATLIVGHLGSSELLLISLPDRRLICKENLDVTEVYGLAADPSGTALAVCSQYGKVHVLAWPLSEMKSP
jgi:hypothetical protein